MIEIEATTIAPEVTRLSDSGEGRVIAIVSNGLYLESFEGYVVAIVDELAVNGPLSLRVRGLSRLMDVVGGHQDLSFRVSRQYIQIGAVAQVSLCNAEQWMPHLPDRLAHQPARNEAAYGLAEAIASSVHRTASGRANEVALADLVRSCHLEYGEEAQVQAWRNQYHFRFFSTLRATCERWPFELRRGEPGERVLKRFADGILRFADALQAGDSQGSSDALLPLVGLGEGLTPAGDDLVSGILAALVWQTLLEGDSASYMEQLRDWAQEATPRTNRISARLLHYAARGILYAPAMALGAALLAGDAKAVKEPAKQLFAIGNTSGVDLATGILVGCLAVWGRGGEVKRKT